jgi:hypothetical protein
MYRQQRALLTVTAGINNRPTLRIVRLYRRRTRVTPTRVDFEMATICLLNRTRDKAAIKDAR